MYRSVEKVNNNNNGRRYSTEIGMGTWKEKTAETVFGSMKNVNAQPTVFLTASGNTAPRFEMNRTFSLPEDTPIGE